MKFLNLLFFFILNISVQSQSITINSLNTQFSFEKEFLVVDREIEFKKVKEYVFDSNKITAPEIGKAYWQKIFINKQELEVSYIEFNFTSSDLISVFYPIKNGNYKEVKTGVSIVKKINAFSDLQKTFIKGDLIDFSKPFYIKNVPMSFFGLIAIKSNEKSKIILHSEKPVELDKNQQRAINKIRSFDYVFTLLIGMIIISFIYVLLHFFITKQVYFLYYALYLFCLIFNYGYRTFFFYNWYSEFHPHFYFYFNENGQMLANLFYILFLKFFVDIKQNYPYLLKPYNVFIGAFITFIAVYNIIIINNPYFPYHRTLIKTSIYFFSFVSYCFLFYMIFKKRLLNTVIVFIGSILLLTGYIVATLHHFFILVPIIIIETILFMSLITYLDVQNLKKSLERDHFFKMNTLKSKLLTLVSHEFRTPLTLISSPIQSELEKTNLSQEQRQKFELIYRNSKRLLTLVDQLLDVAKIETNAVSLKVGQHNVVYFIENVYEGFDYLASKKGVTFLKYSVIGEKVLWFDADILEKILSNLLSNAIKYTPKKGSIICHLKLSNGKLAIQIKNSGKGLTKKQQEKIFEQFYQINEHTDGVGLGLALVNELVQLHKGKISVSSSLNSWTIFNVTIPVNEQYYTKEEKAKEIQQKTFVPKFTENLSQEDKSKLFNTSKELPSILIVDDNKDIQLYLINIFRDSFSILTAENGKIGVEKALKHTPELIISDIMMPVKNGIILCNELKSDERTSHIPIILLTARAGEEHEITGIKSGADAYINKPFNEKLLKAKVTQLLIARKVIHDKYRANFSIAANTIEVSTTEQQFMVRLESVIKKHLTQSDFNVEKFSSEMAMSRMQLHRKLKALFGITSTEFIKTQRLKLAKDLLLSQSEISISQIGYSVGFNNHTYFSKVFKEVYGSSPSNFVKNHKKG